MNGLFKIHFLSTRCESNETYFFPKPKKTNNTAAQNQTQQQWQSDSSSGISTKRDVDGKAGLNLFKTCRTFLGSVIERDVDFKAGLNLSNIFRINDSSDLFYSFVIFVLC